MDWKPLADRVIVRKCAEETETTSGIILVEDTRSILEAEVVSVGDGKYVDGQRVPIAVEAGDVIAYNKLYGTDVPGTENLMLLHEEDILFIKMSD